MTSSIVQTVFVDPTPTHQTPLGGNKSFISFPTATTAGNIVAVVATISNFSGNTVTSVVDSVGNTVGAFLKGHTTAANEDIKLFGYIATSSIPRGDRGGVTSGTTTTLTDSTKTWTVNEWTGKTVFIANSGLTATVTSNTSTQLTFGAIGTAPVANNAYAVGGYVQINWSGFDDFNAMALFEIGGASSIINSSINYQTGVGTGTDNVTSGTAALGSGNIGLLGLTYNDTQTGGTFVPGAGTGFTSLGTSWIFDTGQANMRSEFKNVSNPGTLGATFSSVSTNSYVTLMLAVADTGGAAAPFVQNDWPSSFKARSIGPTDIPTNVLLRGIPAPPAPFNQNDWFAPYRWRWIGSTEIPQDILVRGFPIVPAPFSQKDWFTVYRPRYIPTATEIPPNVALFNSPTFAPAWTDPATQQWCRPMVSTDIPPNLTLLYQPVAPPFGLTDWTPTPRWRSAQQADLSPNLLVLGIPAAAPFTQTQWLAPFRARFIPSDIPANVMQTLLSPPIAPTLTNNPPLPAWPKQVFVTDITIQQK